MLFRDWSLLRFYLVWIYRGPPAAGKEKRPTIPGKAWFLERGHVRMVQGGKETIAHAGEWVFPPVFVDEREFSDDAKLISIRFRMIWPDGGEVFQHPQTLVAPAGELTALKDLTIRMEQIATRISSGTGKTIRTEPCTLKDYMTLESLMAQWICLYADYMVSLGIEPRTPQTANVLLDEVRRRIEELPADMTLNRNELAESIGMSVSHLEVCFSREFNRTPTQYWQELRCQRAKDLLRSGSQSVKEVAFALGFKTPARFATWFRQHTGYRPGQFVEYAQRSDSPRLNEDG